MAVPPEQTETAAFLRGLAGTDLVETHISLVFRGTDTVWKLKKAVRLSFLDFTRLDDRQHFTGREFELNAPAAPGLYRDVVPVVRRDGALALGGEGEVVDWVLRMARVPDDDFLDGLAARGAIDAPMLDAIADAVAARHAQLPPLPDARPDMRAVAAGNARAACEAGLPPDRVAVWAAAIQAALGQRAGWLDQRARDGFVRRAHGDLHLGNLCLWQGRPVLFDALEFNEAMATIDLGYDLAFLLMDLDQRLGRAAANRVLNRYVARTGDAGLVAALSPFLSLRAMIRAHVESRIGHTDTALRYLEAAEAYVRPAPPLMVAVGGLPGSGKSTLARALAPQLGAAPGALVLRSDEIRKRRFGVAPEQKLPRNAYASKVGRAVFEELAAMARLAVHGGHAVVADATFMAPWQRDLIEQAAVGVPFAGLWLTAPLQELERRVAVREGDASDAGVDVVRSAARANLGAMAWTAIDATDADAARGLASGVVAHHIRH